MTRTAERIGLVGYNCSTGLGEKNRQIATWLDIDSWLIKPHRSMPTLPPHPDVDTIVCMEGEVTKLTKFIDRVDTILFDETPYYNNLIQLAHQAGKRIVCIVAHEWFPFVNCDKVDLFICPTNYSFQLLYAEYPCALFPWPVDTERFKFRPRSRCERFLFLNGMGGFKGRKGGEIIKMVMRLWPDFPLYVRSQVPETWPNGTTVLDSPASNKNLYDDGDVLVCPHYCDGTGLEPMEAMACGVPVITTDGKPWDELPALARIPAVLTQQKLKRDVPWYLPDPKALMSICQQLLGTDISAESLQSRAWAESRSFHILKDQLDIMVRRGTPVDPCNRNSPPDV